MNSLTALLASVLVAQGGADHADDVINKLNGWFNNGHPSNDLKEAGVLMHQWGQSGAMDYNQMWRPYTPEECTPVTAHAECQYSDRISCLLINNQVRSPDDGHIPLYQYKRGGVIEDPDETEMMCEYSEDGGTMDRSNAGCGCHNGDSVCESLGDNNSCALEGSAADLSVCWWGPSSLQNMMQNQHGVYNEVVISSATYLKNLPKSPMAFFFIMNSSNSEVEARDTYATFKEAYPSSDVPLIVLDFNAAQNPFSKASSTQMYTSSPTTGSSAMSTTSASGSATAQPNATTVSALTTTGIPTSGASSFTIIGSVFCATLLSVLL